MTTCEPRDAIFDFTSNWQERPNFERVADIFRLAEKFYLFEQTPHLFT